MVIIIKKIEFSFGFLLAKAAEAIEDCFKVSLEPFQISPRQYGLMLAIYENPHATQKDLGETLKIDRTTMVSQIDYLEQLQYVKREKNLQDRRSYTLVLSEDGKNLLERCWNMLIESEQKILSALDPEEKERLRQMLVTVYSSPKINEWLLKVDFQ